MNILEKAIMQAGILHVILCIDIISSNSTRCQKSDDLTISIVRSDHDPGTVKQKLKTVKRHSIVMHIAPTQI